MFSFNKKRKPSVPANDSAPNQVTEIDAAKDESVKKPGLFSRLRQGLSKTSATLKKDISVLLSGKIDDALLEELETRLLMADVGIEATSGIIDNLSARVKRKELADASALMSALQNEMTTILTPCNKPLEISPTHSPFVILVVGVNGAGKTTTIGKLAKRLQEQGKSVLLAAGDTFRAAAVEQLQTWGNRNKVNVIAQGTGADSASVIFDAVQAAQARGIDVLIADTAGRLHTQTNLMEELKKVQRVMRKLDDTSPHETLLVVDASTGQNALNQAQQFNAAIGLTGIAITKLDGTAKGGILFAIANKLGIPIRFIGVGESAEDLRTFNAPDFVKALLDQQPDEPPV